MSNPKSATGAAGRLPSRDEIDPKYKWRLEDIYPDDAAWDKAYGEVLGLLAEAAGHRAEFTKSAESLLKCLQWLDQIGRETSRVYIYAMLRHDEDTRNPANQERMDKARSLSARIAQETAFFRPELLKVPVARIREFLDSSEDLKIYSHFLDDIMRRSRHVRSEEVETVLAHASEVLANPRKVFSMLNDADLQFPSITDEDGSIIEVTKGRYPVLMQRRSRRVRRDAFEAMTNTYWSVRNTMAAALDGAVKANVLNARVRNYPSALAAALDEEGIDTAVYDNLLKTIGENLAPLHRYHALRKQLLGLDSLRAYDLHVPLVTDVEYKISFDEAGEVIRAALAPLGEEYGQVLEEALNGGWMDVYENQGKRGGAYSAGGAYGAHPYILLNWQDDLNSLFTLAHELGHAVHSYLSEKYQPYVYANYTIFVAEVASTVNEGLLARYLLSSLSDPAQRRLVLNHYLDSFRGTVFTQVMFAEFEQEIHRRVEQGEPLTADVLTGLYRSLCEKYWGPHVEVDERGSVLWSRIPHFYYGFYVYKYATGFSAAVALTDHILAENESARRGSARTRYLDFLKSGGSDYPLNLLRRAGVDLTSPQPLVAAVDYFDQLVSQLAQEYGLGG